MKFKKRGGEKYRATMARERAREREREREIKEEEEKLSGLKS